MGLLGHPWLLIPLGESLWVGLIKIEIKVIKTKQFPHNISFKSI